MGRYNRSDLLVQSEIRQKSGLLSQNVGTTESGACLDKSLN